MSRPDLFAVDAGLEEALQDARRWCARLTHGRIFLVLEVEAGRVADHELKADAMMTRDLERLMQEKPGATRVLVRTGVRSADS